MLFKWMYNVFEQISNFLWKQWYHVFRSCSWRTVSGISLMVIVNLSTMNICCLQEKKYISLSLLIQFIDKCVYQYLHVSQSENQVVAQFVRIMTRHELYQTFTIIFNNIYTTVLLKENQNDKELVFLTIIHVLIQYSNRNCSRGYSNCPF